MPVSGKELATLDFANLIGGPLNAVVEAQAKSALATVNFIKETSFDKDGNLINVDFKYNREGEEFSLTVPFLTLLPVPYITISEAEIEFNAKITSINESKMDDVLNTDGNTEASSWWASAKLQSKTSYQRKTTASEKEERTFDMHVRVLAGNQEIPAGAERLLTILEGSIEEKKGRISEIRSLRIKDVNNDGSIQLEGPDMEFVEKDAKLIIDGTIEVYQISSSNKGNVKVPTLILTEFLVGKSAIIKKLRSDKITDSTKDGIVLKENTDLANIDKLTIEGNDYDANVENGKIKIDVQAFSNALKDKTLSVMVKGNIDKAEDDSITLKGFDNVTIVPGAKLIIGGVEFTVNTVDGTKIKLNEPHSGITANQEVSTKSKEIKIEDITINAITLAGTLDKITVKKDAFLTIRNKTYKVSEVEEGIIKIDSSVNDILKDQSVSIKMKPALILKINKDALSIDLNFTVKKGEILTIGGIDYTVSEEGKSVKLPGLKLGSPLIGKSVIVKNP